MDEVISVRVDAEVAALLDSAAKRQRRTKREFLESAIRREAEAQESEVERRRRIIDEAFGAWKRDEPTDETAQNIRKSWEDEWDRRGAAVRAETPDK